MADEIELKFEIENYEELVKKIIKLAEFKSSAYELTVMYDEGKKLFEKDARLRLRKIIDLTNDKETAEFSYKKPKTREGIKIEEEYEVSVSNFKETEEILKNIGFEKVSSYERIRDTFLSDETKITIDSFPFGDYLEIEGDLSKIKLFAQELNLDMSKNITKSCDDIYADVCIADGKDVDDNITFENSEELEKEKDKRAVFLK